MSKGTDLVFLLLVVGCCLAWWQPTSTDAQLIANTTSGVQVEFAPDSPSIDLTPRGTQGSLRPQEQVTLSLNSLSEYSQTDGTFFHSATLVNGFWAEVNDTRYNATLSFVYTASLGFTNGEGNLTLNGAVELQFFLFDQDALLSVGPGLLPFTVSPSLAKFSLKVTDWPWEGREDHGLEVRMDIAPEYNRSERFDSSPQAGLTTFKLFGQYPLNPDTITQIRVVEAVEIDGVVLDQGGVDYRTDRGQLLMQFDHFTSSLLYDPAGGDQQDSDNTALIVALSVILPVAAIVVILVGAAVLVTYLKREKFRPSTSAIDIGEEHM